MEKSKLVMFVALLISCMTVIIINNIIIIITFIYYSRSQTVLCRAQLLL